MADLTREEIIERGEIVLTHEYLAIQRAVERLGEDFATAARWIAQSGFVHVSGVGKSGDVASKMAGMLCSYRIPAAVLDPTRALHGDLGRVRIADVAIFISRSGECAETIEVAKRISCRTVALTTPGSSLAKLCGGAVVDCSVSSEADGWGLAPSSSTAVALAVADALCVVAAKLTGFEPDGWRTTHPGGPR